MKRDKKIEIRHTEEEYNNIKYISARMNISISEYIRQAIREYENPNINKREIAMHVFNIQSYLNAIYQKGMTAEIYNLLGMEMDKLWQYLN